MNAFFRICVIKIEKKRIETYWICNIIELK